MSKFQTVLERLVGPLAEKMAANKTIQSITNGMMAVLPISLGVAFIAIVGQFPFEPWQMLLAQLGLTQVITDFINITTGLYALYIVVTIAYETAKIEEVSPITPTILSLSFFLILVPQQLVTKFYAYMKKRNMFVIKLPDSVPNMVSESLGPTFIAMLIFIQAFILKAGFNVSPFGDAITFVNSIVTAPLSFIGSSPLSVILVFTFANLLWFFGIHPAAIINLFYAVTAPIYIYNIEAFLAGNPQPYLEFMFVTAIIMVGGTGNTIGLAIDMLTAKSEKFKAMRALTLVPSIFNINEPYYYWWLFKWWIYDNAYGD